MTNMSDSSQGLSSNIQKDNPFTLGFVGIGPQKTASTWLHEMLMRHPSICLPVATKELQFFDRLYDKGVEDYLSYFKHQKPGQICGEITPGYFDTPETPKRISEHFPETKIIVSLRNPTKRTESLFLHHLRKGRVSPDFNEALIQLPRIKESGKYRKHLLNWYNFFNAEQIKIILTEDIALNPEEVLVDLYQFLSVEHHPLPENLHQMMNKAGMPKYPWLAKYTAKAVTLLKDTGLHQVVELGKTLGLKKIYSGSDTIPSIPYEQKKNLLSYYEEDIQFVEELLNRKLAMWREIE